MICWRTTTERWAWTGLLGLAFLGSGCGYQLAGTGTLPRGITCLSVDTVVNQSNEGGLEVDLTKGLEDELARRGFACGAGRANATLSGIIETLELTPAILREQGRTGIASYRVRTVTRAWVEVSGRRVWESGAVVETGEMAGELEDAGQAGMTSNVQGGVGLERKGAVQRIWARMSPEIAARLIQRLTSDL